MLTTVIVENNYCRGYVMILFFFFLMAPIPYLMYSIAHIHAYEEKEKEKERDRNHVPKVDKTILSRTDTVCTVSTNTNLISRSDWSINFSTVITSICQ